ncbi:hypothetical protein J3P71_03975 [Rhizobium leguminosarum]|uniref:hypothetical protein n=1 Tax=Rhizobium leguminosarum TaxID=384 RepID=UPI001441A1DD|nr:hypothetical protein [Rhizobium leguminosarum]MBY5841422.1 hypothetical protein [Rhizobium leguminosarum]NKM81417.1 hypothetical protein [Rhizobium leguminosarum bv. viciae]QSZ08945.1 hypothetical protein J3P71_03975 [Rhizobium leguminosarum]
MANWWENDPVVGGEQKDAAPARPSPKTDAPPPKTPDKYYLENRETGFVDKLWDGAKRLGFPVYRMQRDLQTVDDLVRTVARGATFGWADTAVGKLSGTGTEFERARTSEAMTRTGNAGKAAEFGGSMMTAGGLMKAAPALFGAATGQSLIARGVAGAGSGAAIGAVDAAGHDENITRGAVVGGVAGGILAPVGELAGKGLARLTNRLSGVENPTTAALYEKAKSLYRAADDAGVRLSQSSWNDAVHKVNVAAAEAAVDARTDKAAFTALKAFDELAGQQMTLSQVEKQRQFINRVITNLTDDQKSSLPVLMSMRSALDDWVGGLRKSDIVAGDLDVGVTSLVEARKLWNSRSKLEVIEGAFDKAENAAPTQPFDSAIRSQFRVVANRPDFKKRWTAEEQRAILGVVRGGSINGLISSLGLLGRLAGPAGLGGGVGFGLGGPTGAVVGAGVGATLQGVQSSAARGAADDARLLIGTGSPPPLVGGAGTLGRTLGVVGGITEGKKAMEPEKLKPKAGLFQ